MWEKRMFMAGGAQFFEVRSFERGHAAPRKFETTESRANPNNSASPDFLAKVFHLLTEQRGL